MAALDHFLKWVGCVIISFFFCFGLYFAGIMIGLVIAFSLIIGTLLFLVGFLYSEMQGLHAAIKMLEDKLDDMKNSPKE
ncbi:hypothetical protein ACI7RC_11135 [Brevibacillus sp. B_LB10_24]|uniref:hypothetical protein n=1 Tax=Brevibacillus sp. B_LB10_24 TaxID=3380645 RepID=UPI0038BB2143